MDNNLVAKSTIRLNVPREKAWDALVNPVAIKQYLFGTDTVSDWKEGSPIFWRGEWEGKPYEDKGIILQCKAERVLQYSHFSPLSGAPDRPENYHTVTIELTSEGTQTLVSLAQDNNGTEEERAHSEANWALVLSGLKKYLEA